MNPWVILAAALALAGTHAGAFRYGRHWEQGRQALAQQAAAQQAQTAAAKAGADDAARQGQIDRSTDRSQDEVLAYAQTDAGRVECFDDDARRLFNGAGGYADPVRPAPHGPRARPAPAPGVGN